MERGKFRWGSRSDLRVFEQQLVYSVSIENKRYETRMKKSKLEDRKKYCLDYNRGTCRQDHSHEGKLNGQTVFKLLVCKLCLAKDDVEEGHPAKDCPRYK